MSRFPLYDSLYKDTPNKELTVSQKRYFIKNVQEIDKTGHELLYALIKMYQIENNDGNTSFTLPYDGKYINKNIKFDFDKFPKKLKQILYKFLKAHMVKMEEEETIEQQTPVKRV